MPERTMPAGMTEHEIMRLVNRYIGVSAGTLACRSRFSYRTHGDFYSEYCDLNVSFEGHEERLARRFMSILAFARDERPGEGPSRRDRALSARRTGAPTTRPSAHRTSWRSSPGSNQDRSSLTSHRRSRADVVLRALTDAETLIQNVRTDERRGPGPHGAPRLPPGRQHRRGRAVPADRHDGRHLPGGVPSAV